jgi:preprotein translocase subunit SecG
MPSTRGNVISSAELFRGEKRREAPRAIARVVKTSGGVMKKFISLLTCLMFVFCLTASSVFVAQADAKAAKKTEKQDDEKKAEKKEGKKGKKKEGAQ